MSRHSPRRIQYKQKNHLEKNLDDPKSAQSTVTCIYQTNIAGSRRTVTVVWYSNLMNHSLCISVGDSRFCKIDVKPWQFWSKKGFKSLDMEGTQVEVFWDFRSAKFSNGPEPLADYFVALICHNEVVLLLGDRKKKAYKKSKSRPAIDDAVLVYKKENVFAKKSFCTRARFDERRNESHCIVVESSMSGPREPEMWISIDGFVVIHVNNLQWKFRGNETVFVNKQPVQVLWDVHDWLFNSGGHGLFIFKPDPPERSDSCHGSSGGEVDSSSSSSSGSGKRRNWSIRAPEYCLFLYAWMID